MAGGGGGESGDCGNRHLGGGCGGAAVFSWSRAAGDEVCFRRVDGLAGEALAFVADGADGRCDRDYGCGCFGRAQRAVGYCCCAAGDGVGFRAVGG